MFVLTFIASALLLSLNVRLPNADGGLVSARTDGRRISVHLFITPECPISRRYAPEMARIAREYGSSRFRFFATFVDPAVTAAAARRYRSEYQLPFPSLLDARQTFARSLGVTTVPTAAVFDVSGQLRYFGRIDDRFADWRVERAKARRQDLRAALSQILAGKKVTISRTNAVGCALPRVP